MNTIHQTGSQPVSLSIVDYAEEFLEFRHQHEGCWEIGDAALTAVVFALLFCHKENASHIAGMVSHIIVALLFIVKALSFAARRLYVKYGDPHGMG